MGDLFPRIEHPGFNLLIVSILTLLPWPLSSLCLTFGCSASSFVLLICFRSPALRSLAPLLFGALVLAPQTDDLVFSAPAITSFIRVSRRTGLLVPFRLDPYGTVLSHLPIFLGRTMGDFPILESLFTCECSLPPVESRRWSLIPLFHLILGSPAHQLHRMPLNLVHVD